MAVSKLQADFEVDEVLPARVQEKLSGFANAPTQSEWLAEHLSEEHQAMYESLMKIRYTVKAKYPVHFRYLIEKVGYLKMENAQKRLVDEFVEGIDFVILPATGKNSGRGRPSQDFALTIKCAQLFAVNAQTDQGKKIAAFFVEALEVLQDYHKLTLLLNERRKGLIQRHEVLLEQHPRTIGFSAVYQVIVGCIGGQLLVKLGKTDHLPNRMKALKTTFGECYLYDVIVVRNGTDLENSMKANTFLRKHRLFEADLPECWKSQTELYKAKDTSLLDRFGRVIRDLAKELNTEMEAHRIHKERMQELENEARKLQNEAGKLQVEKLKALKDLPLPPEDLKEVVMALIKQKGVTVSALDVTDNHSDVLGDADYEEYVSKHVVSDRGSRLPLLDVVADLAKWAPVRDKGAPAKHQVQRFLEKHLGKMIRNQFGGTFLTGWRHYRLEETCSCCEWRNQSAASS